MKIEYDSERDLLYLWLAKPGSRAAQTRTVAAGVHADFDRNDRLIGVEILDAKDVLGGDLEFEVTRTPVPPARGGGL